MAKNEKYIDAEELHQRILFMATKVASYVPYCCVPNGSNAPIEPVLYQFTNQNAQSAIAS